MLSTLTNKVKGVTMITFSRITLMEMYRKESET